MTATERRWAIAVRAATGLALVGLGVLWLVGPGLIADAYHQKPGALLQGVISGQGRFPLDGYLVFFRRTVLALAAAAAMVGTLLPVLFRWGIRSGVSVSRAAVWLMLALMVVTIVGLRMRTFDEAQDRDLMAYMMVAEGLLDGRTLYDGVWDHKPPAIHLTYAAAAYVFGPTQRAIFALGVLAALVTLAACYRAGAVVGGTAGGLAAAGLWTLASGDLLLQANQPNAEVFINACLVWAFTLVLPREETPAWRRPVLIGALLFWGSLYKPVVIAVAGLVLAMDAVNRLLEDTPGSWPARVWRAARPGVVAGAVAAAGWVLVFAYFAVVGRFAQFEEAVFAYNRDYAGSLLQNLLASFLPTGAVVWTAAAYFPLLVVTAAGLLLAAAGSARRHSLLLLAYLAGAWVAVAMPGRLYPHYYQMLLPPVAIGFGWLTILALRSRAWLGLTALALAVSMALTTRVYQSLVPEVELSRFKFGGYGYDLVETQRMAPWIGQHVAPGEAVYHWGADPGIYFFAHRASPVSFVYNMPLTDGTDRSRRFSAQVLSQLQARPPALVVAARREFSRLDHPIEVWIDAHYRAVPGPDGVERFVFLVPRAGQ